MSKKKKTVFEKEPPRHEYSEDLRKLFLFAKRESGKDPFSIVKEYWVLGRGDRKLTLNDYFLYGLYDDKKYPMEAKSRFISEKLHWPITRKCCDLCWWALTEDKWISYNLLARFGIKTPDTIGVIDQSPRLFGSDHKITSPTELKAFLKQTDSYPIFGKPNRGLGSAGALVITGIDDTNVFLDQSEPLTFERFFTEIIGNTTYLLQKFIENHPQIKAFTKYVATVRTINFVGTDFLATPFCLIKIPSSTNIADNYWRTGNMIADVDPESGVIRRAIRGKGIEIEELETHPETGDKLVDLALPHWDRVRHINEACARLFAPVRYHSLDIALTSEGPVVVEVNIGGSFVLPQLASGTGLLTDEVRKFFQSCGWKFRSK